MIAFIIGVVALWIVWRCLIRSTHVVEIAPPAPSVTIVTRSIVIHVHHATFAEDKP